MTWEAVIEAVALGAAVLGWIYAAFIAHGRARRAEFDGLDERADGMAERIAALEAGAGDGVAAAGRLSAAERELAALRLHVAEHCVARDDWVPTISRMFEMLEGHTEMLGRLDERTRMPDGTPPGREKRHA